MADVDRLFAEYIEGQLDGVDPIPGASSISSKANSAAS